MAPCTKTKTSGGRIDVGDKKMISVFCLEFKVPL